MDSERRARPHKMVQYGAEWFLHGTGLVLWPAAAAHSHCVAAAAVEAARARAGQCGWWVCLFEAQAAVLLGRPCGLV